MYIEKTYDLGDVKEIARYYPGRYGAPGCKRRPKKKATPEDIRRQNQGNRARKIQRLILANFKENDWYLTLTYRKEERPGSMEEAKRRRKKFFADMRKAYRKAGYEFKFVCITELGKRGAVHHHLIIENIASEKLNTTKMITKLWKYGGRHFDPLYEEGEFEELADYLTKEQGKECNYTRSKNLIVPQPVREKVYRRKWDEEPKPEEGYYIIKDTLINGINPVTGRPYQHYMMRRKGGSDGSEGIRENLVEGPGKAGWRGGMAGRMHGPWGAGHQTGVHPPGGRDPGARDADGPGKRAPYPEKAVQHPDIRGLWARAKRGAKRLAQAVAGKRMEERQREGSKERRRMGSSDGKGRAPHVPDGGRKA